MGWQRGTRGIWREENLKHTTPQGQGSDLGVSISLTVWGDFPWHVSGHGWGSP